jgi:hypothetical protein
MKRFYLAILFLLSTVSVSLADDYSANIKASAQQMRDAFKRMDAVNFLSYTLPAMTQTTNGKNWTADQINKDFEQLTKAGYSILDVAVGNPGDVKEINGKLYAFIPETIKIKTPDGVYAKENRLIALSEDQGKRWLFVDVDQLTPADLDKVLPDLQGKLDMPAPKETVFTPTASPTK